MKRSTVFAVMGLATALVASTFAQGGSAPTAAPSAAGRSAALELKKLDPEARRKVMLEKRRKSAKKAGGLLERPDALALKVISVENAQKVVDAARLDSIVKASRLAAKLPFVLGNKDKSAITIELVECDKMGALGIFPEDCKAVVNVKKLAADGAAADVVAERVRKELIRAAFLALGSGYSPTPCYANHVTTMKELDAINPRMPSPDTLMHLGLADRLGIRRVKYVSYRTACEEGWAPAPATAEQKAIWDELHALPTEPIVIKPESDKKK